MIKEPACRSLAALGRVQPLGDQQVLEAVINFTAIIRTGNIAQNLAVFVGTYIPSVIPGQKLTGIAQLSQAALEVEVK